MLTFLSTNFVLWQVLWKWQQKWFLVAVSLQVTWDYTRRKDLSPPRAQINFTHERMILIGFNIWCTYDQSEYGGACIICPPDVGEAVPKQKRYVPSLNYPAYYTHIHTHTQLYFCTFILKRVPFYDNTNSSSANEIHSFFLPKRRDPKTHLVTISCSKVQNFRSRYDSSPNNLWKY